MLSKPATLRPQSILGITGRFGEWRWAGEKRSVRSRCWSRRALQALGHVFYERPNRILANHGFGAFVEDMPSALS